jgi:hypothetical protein
LIGTGHLEVLVVSGKIMLQKEVVDVYGIAQPQDQTVARFVLVVKNLTFQYMTTNQ